LPSPFISLCMITKDESETLGRCLGSVAPLVDEIVIVDTGSRDQTVSIAEKAGAGVIRAPWNDDFSAARNLSLEAASGEWILVVDADEVLENAHRARLEERLRSHDAPAYSVEIVSPKGAGLSERAHITRLFRNEPAHRYQGRVHEQILGAVCRKLGRETWTPPRSELRFIHDGYRPDKRSARKKAERNRRLLSQEIRDRPSDPGPRFLMAREIVPRVDGDLLAMPEAEEALALLAPVIDRLTREPRLGIADPALALYARLSVALGDSSAAERCLVKARALLGDTVRLIYAEAEMRLQQAIACGESAGQARELFLRTRTALEGCASIPSCPQVRDAWAPLRAAACLVLDAERVGMEVHEQASESMTSENSVEQLLFGSISAARGGDVKQATARLVSALGRRSDDPRIWWSLGALSFLASEPQRGAAMMAKAAEAAPRWSAARAFDGARLQRTALPTGLLSLWCSVFSRSGKTLLTR